MPPRCTSCVSPSDVEQDRRRDLSNASPYHLRHENDAARRVASLQNGRTIATAESCTAGRIAGALAAVEQAFAFFAGGLVAYQERVKRELLGVTARSVLSFDAAEEMALGVAKLLDADVTVSTSGVRSRPRPRLRSLVTASADGDTEGRTDAVGDDRGDDHDRQLPRRPLDHGSA